MSTPLLLGQRLNGVAAIMAYLGLRGRESYRRLRDDGLPIHRDPANSARVWAYAGELDTWDRQRSLPTPPAPAAGETGQRAR